VSGIGDLKQSVYAAMLLIHIHQYRAYNILVKRLLQKKLMVWERI